jgi:hypothetical protein
MNGKQFIAFGWRLMCGPLLLVELAVFSGKLVYAEPISKIDGTIQTFTLTSPSPFGSGALLAFNGTTTSLDSTPVSIPTTFGPLSISRNPNSQSGFTEFDVGPALTIGAVKINRGLPGGGDVFFDLSSLFAAVPTDPAHSNTLAVLGREDVNTNTSTLDFSRFNPGMVELDFETSPGIDLASVITDGGMATGTGSFHQIGVAFVLVPEPPTIILLATGALGLLGYAWRQRRVG